MKRALHALVVLPLALSATACSVKVHKSCYLTDSTATFTPPGGTAGAPVAMSVCSFSGDRDHIYLQASGPKLFVTLAIATGGSSVAGNFAFQPWSLPAAYQPSSAGAPTIQTDPAAETAFRSGGAATGTVMMYVASYDANGNRTDYASTGQGSLAATGTDWAVNHGEIGNAVIQFETVPVHAVGRSTGGGMDGGAADGGTPIEAGGAVTVDFNLADASTESKSYCGDPAGGAACVHFDACTTDEECQKSCGDLVCRKGGGASRTCCIVEGRTCGNSGECCDGLTCTNGFCLGSALAAKSMCSGGGNLPSNYWTACYGNAQACECNVHTGDKQGNEMTACPTTTCCTLYMTGLTDGEPKQYCQCVGESAQWCHDNLASGATIVGSCSASDAK